jgi:hypothetical protein
LWLFHDAQGDGACAICGKPASVVDHRHSDGEVRGLHCNSCNLGIGHFRDDPAILERAILYLDPNRKCRCGGNQPDVPVAALTDQGRDEQLQ